MFSPNHPVILKSEHIKKVCPASSDFTKEELQMKKIAAMVEMGIKRPATDFSAWQYLAFLERWVSWQRGICFILFTSMLHAICRERPTQYKDVKFSEGLLAERAKGGGRWV
jgi:hypothetical protein